MQYRFTTPSGFSVECRRTILPYASALDGFAERLDRERGALFSSGVDYPGRYSRWEFGFAKPPLEVIGRGGELVWRALNPRGEALLRLLAPILGDAPAVVVSGQDARELRLRIGTAAGAFSEEERSLQPSLMSPLRRFIARVPRHRRSVSRAVWRLRLRPALPVRADRAPPAAPAGRQGHPSVLPRPDRGRRPAQGSRLPPRLRV